MSVRVQELDGRLGFLAPLLARTPTLIVMLEEVGGHVEVQLRTDRTSRSVHRRNGQISFIPAEVEAWQNAQDVRYLRQVVIGFTADSIQSDCRLMFADKRLWRLASLLASEVLSDAPLDATYGEGLGAAMLASLSAMTHAEYAQSGLTPRQLRRVTDHMLTNPFAKIRVRDLAALTGVSQSHFSRSFKTTTGVPPHRWLLEFRIAESQKLLLDTSMPVAEIAYAVGFADQGHFTRTFRATTGATPAAWRKSRKG
jgi:AraC family transcriptional regulator